MISSTRQPNGVSVKVRHHSRDEEILKYLDGGYTEGDRVRVFVVQFHGREGSRVVAMSHSESKADAEASAVRSCLRRNRIEGLVTVCFDWIEVEPLKHYGEPYAEVDRPAEQREL